MKRVTRNGVRKIWSEACKIQAATVYLSCGNLTATAVATGVPYETLKHWKTAEWWHDICARIRDEESLAMDAKLQKIVQKGLDIANDRLENGNFQFNQKTGEVVRVPVNLKDSVKAATDLMQRQEAIRKRPDKVEVEKTIDARLAKLAEEFKTFAKAKTIEGECVAIQP